MRALLTIVLRRFRSRESTSEALQTAESSPLIAASLLIPSDSALFDGSASHACCIVVSITHEPQIPIE